MHWFMGGLNSFVEPPLIALNLANDIRLDFLSGGQTLEQMFEAGELDALLSLYIPKLTYLCTKRAGSGAALVFCQFP
jgi:hypothetical protein